MVLADSHGISRAPCYLGTCTARQQRFRLRDSHPLRPGTHTGSTIVLHSHARAGRPGTTRPTTPMMQPLPGLTHHRFGLFRVRSPLLTESLLFSLPVGTEMFHFPTFPPRTLCIQMRVTTHNTWRGFPIRRPSDHSSFISSPRLIADYRVLHRLLMPRHPPCALKNLPHDHRTHRPATTGGNPPQLTGGDQSRTLPHHTPHHPTRRHRRSRHGRS